MCEVLEKLRNKLIVSVQALPGNPLRDTYCIAHLAAAAAAGGAAAIRANGVDPEIKTNWVHSIVKRLFSN